MDTLSKEQQQIVFPNPPPSLLLPKACLLCLFQKQYNLLQQDFCIWQSIIQPDSKPPPFLEGAISQKDHCTFLSAVQLAFDHAFTITYSDIFHHNAGDNPFCPEHATPLPSAHLSPHSEQACFNHLMADFLDPWLTSLPDPS